MALLILLKKIQIKKYWELLSNNYEKTGEKEVLKNLDILFDKSIEKHLLSDREIGLFLSGGTDSTALAHKISKKSKIIFQHIPMVLKMIKNFQKLRVQI